MTAVTPIPPQHRFKTTKKSEPDTSRFLKLLSLRVWELLFVSNRGLIYWHLFRVFVGMGGSERTKCAERRKICEAGSFFLSLPSNSNGEGSVNLVAMSWSDVLMLWCMSFPSAAEATIASIDWTATWTHLQASIQTFETSGRALATMRTPLPFGTISWIAS